MLLHCQVSIPVWCDLELKGGMLAQIVGGFQFQYGAIWSGINSMFLITSFGVSIPVWCDLEGTSFNNVTAHYVVSIPVWCDLEMLRVVLSLSFLCFNSSMVRFGGYCPLMMLAALICFNSSMVRFGEGN